MNSALDDRPRGCLAFLAAALGAAAAGAVASGMGEMFVPVLVFGFLIACAHVALLAMPIYVWIERYHRPTLVLVLLASALVGALPIVLMMAAAGGPWRDVAQAALILGGCGACGGFAFWIVLSLPRHHPPAQ